MYTLFSSTTPLCTFSPMGNIYKEQMFVNYFPNSHGFSLHADIIFCVWELMCMSDTHLSTRIITFLANISNCIYSINL